MVGQDGDAQAVDRGVAHRHHSLASRARRDAKRLLRAILRLEMPFEFVGSVVRRERGTNVKGVLFTMQKALPLMRDGGSLTLTSSTTSIKGTGAFSVYSATKAAARNFARSWILDLKDRLIRINAVSPGLTETAGLDELFGRGEQANAAKAYLVGQIRAGRIGQPEEIVKAVLFLASNDASYVNGVELFVDGGQA